MRILIFHVLKSTFFVLPLTLTAQWIALGPIVNPGMGIGRIECIAFDPLHNGTTNKIMYVGSPFGGLWKSTDDGLHWDNTSCSTDKLPFIGVADIVINPSNPKEIFIATGTKYKRKYIFPLEIYKSRDGGLTWMRSSRGIRLNPDKLNCIARLIMDPSDPKVLFAATSNGIYKSMDSGSSWKTKLSGDFHGLIFNSSNPKIIYAAGTRSDYSKDIVVMGSTDCGDNWKVIADTAVFRSKENTTVDIAVAPSSPDIIYVLTGNNDQNRSNDLYVSTDGGKSWKNKTIPYPNDHRDKTSIGVSPVDPGEIYIGKTWEFYRSIHLCDTNFNNRMFKSQWERLNINHADIHQISIAPVSREVFVATDGGLYNATTNRDASKGLNIATITSLGSSESKSDFVITGNQDCGTNIFDAALPDEKQWRNVLGGDGRESFIDYKNENIILSTTVNLGTSVNYGPNQYSVDGGFSFLPISNPKNPDLKATNNGPIAEDPFRENEFYFGYDQLYKATFIYSGKNDVKWEQLSHIPNMAPYSVLTSISVAQTDNKIIYAGFVHGRIFKTASGGEGVNCSSGCWKEISPFNDLCYNNCVKTTLKTNDPNCIWAAFSGGNTFFDQMEDTSTRNANKIMYSMDGGETWKSYGQGLPATPVYSLVYASGTNDLLFAATDNGVYFRDRKMKRWKIFEKNLPHVSVSELTYNQHEQTLYAGTYGRGLWKVTISDRIKFKPAPVH